MVEHYVMVKCLDGKYRPKLLTGLYCKHYKFDKDCFFKGCCIDKKNKYQCCTAFEHPLLCENFIFKYGEKNF